jgi:hypothetical protein
VSGDNLSLDYAYNGVQTNHLEGSDGTVRSLYIGRDGTYMMECWGAAGYGDGGNDTFGTISRGIRGKGAYIAGTVTLAQGDLLYIVVGGAGGGNNNLIKAGWNTTDRSTTSAPYPVYTGNGPDNDGCGGGATDIRLNGITLWHRLIVSAGGGGGTYSSGNGDDGADLQSKMVLAGRNGQYTDNLVPMRQNGALKGAGPGLANAQLENRGFGTAAGATFNEQNGNARCSNAVRGSGGGGWYGGAYQNLSSAVNNYSGLCGAGGSSWLNTDALYNAWNDDVNKDKYVYKDTYKMKQVERKTGGESMPTPANASVTETGHTKHGYARITYLGE